MTTPTTRNNSNISAPSAGQFGLKNLVALLRSEGHRALNGVSAFTLTTGVLQQLNTECRRQSLADRSGADDSGVDRSHAEKDRRLVVSTSRGGDQEKGGDQERGGASKEDTEWHYQMQFVKDFMEYSPSLKLNCGTDTSTSPISLHRFSNLTSLNLQRVPVQRLQGLQSLRNSLTTITVYKGLDKVKDLMELCGGDMSAALSWSQLKSVSLVFNSLSELDDSLRLMPHVQVLDLGHNLLQKCDHFLEHLVDVRRMSLGYNLLTQVPSMSATTRASLTCLVLRANNLDSLHGLEGFTCLQQLDVGENCINKHSLLQPLSSLIKLTELQVDGNPLSYHRLHRPLTASCLARQAANVKFELDKKKLTTSEISYFSQVKTRLASTAGVNDSSKGGPEARQTRTSKDGASGTIPAAAVLCEPDRDVQPSGEMEASNNRRKNRHKKMKPRDSQIVDIDDTDDSQDNYTRRPGSARLPPHLEKLMTDRHQEAMTTRREIEELRTHYGHNWLQAIEDRNVFNKNVMPRAGAPPTSPHKPSKRSGATVGLASQASTGSTTSQETLLQVGAYAQPVDKEEANTCQELPTKDPMTPVMATIARIAAGLSESPVDRAAAGLEDPDLILSSAEVAYSTTTASTDDDDGKTTTAKYRPFSIPDKGDSDYPRLQTQNTNCAPNNESINDPKFQAESTTSDANKGHINGPVCQPESTNPDPVKGDLNRSMIHAENTKQDTNKGDTNAPVFQVENTKQDTNRGDSNGPMFQTLNAKSNPDNELTDSQKETCTGEVVTDQISTAQLPDVVPTRQVLLAQTPQTQVAPAVKSGDKSHHSDESASQVSVPSSRDRQTGKPVWRRGSAEEDQEVIESMFVSCPLQDNEVIILTLTCKCLVEKNFRGKVTERLELASLNHLDWKRVTKPQITVSDSRKTATMSGQRLPNDARDDQTLKDNRKAKTKDRADGDDGSMQLDLRFDYLKKDKQSRCYIMEIRDGNLLVSHLQPFLDARESHRKTAPSIVLQCLKCSHIMPQTGLDHARNSGKTLQDSTEILDNTQVCPRCGSTLIIELTSPASTGRNTGASSRKRRSSQNSSVPGLSGKNKTMLPLMKNVLNRITSQATFSRKARAERISPEVSSSPVSSSPVPAAPKEISPTLLARAHLSTTHDIIPGEAADRLGRDRTSAFRAPANFARAVAEMEDRADSGDHLVCVEDYFSAEVDGPITSDQLAEFTSSLRRDRPTRTSQTHVEAAYSVSPHTEHVSQAHAFYGSRVHVSQSYVEGAKFESGALQVAEQWSRPITIEGAINKRSGAQGRPGDGREEKGAAWGAADAGTSLSGRAEPGTHGRSKASLYSRSYDRHVHVPRLVRLLSGQNVAIDSSFGRREASGFSTQPETSPGTAACPATPSDLSFHVENTAVVCSSVPTSMAFFPGNVVPTGQFGISSDGVSPVFRSPVHSSFSSEKSDPGELTESPSGHDIRSASVESGKPVGGSYNSDGGIALATSARGDGFRDRPQDDIVSIYDFSVEPKQSPRGGGVMAVSSAACVSSEDKICQFQQGSGGLNSSVADSQGGDTPTNDVLPVEVQLDKSQWSNTPEAAPTATSPSEGKEAGDDASDDEDTVANYGFHHLNHRLTLYLMMSLFGTDEEFLCKIHCPIVQYIIAQPYDGMLVMSSQRFYVLKFASEDRRQPTDQWIQCVDIQPIPELRYIDVGLGGQTLRLEFVTDCSSFTLVTGNRDKTAQFVEALHGHLTRYAIRHGINSAVIVNEDADQSTINNLDQDVVSKVTPGQKLLYYCMGFLDKGGDGRTPVSVVVTSSEICLVQANQQWPQPRLQGPVTVETVGRQFTVLERQKINNVASMKVCQHTMRRVSLELFGGADGAATCWNITLASRRSTGDFIHAVSDPWAEEFGVGMEVTYMKLDF